MNLASLQTITWGTVTAAVASALLLASASTEHNPAAARRAPRPTHQAVRDSAQTVAPQLAEAMPIPTVLPETAVKP